MNGQGARKLEGSRNWNIWKFQTTVLLRGQGLYGIVSGTATRPEDGKKGIVGKLKMQKLKHCWSLEFQKKL